MVCTQPFSLFTKEQPNGKLHPRRECVESAVNRKIPQSAFPLYQQAAKHRRVKAMLGGDFNLLYGNKNHMFRQTRNLTAWLVCRILDLPHPN